ncbi:MAG: cation:dicarboxylase symporter family transporter [Candidatus Dependentiae bacterium]|jgi:Na+/H+-dicarboxylate symporter
MKQLSLPLQLLIILAIAVLCGAWFPTSVVQMAYTMSSLLKEVLEFFLPLVVFFFISNGVFAFAHNSLMMILLLLSTVFVSNILTSIYTFLVGGSAVGYLTGSTLSVSTVGGRVITPLYSLGLPSLISSEGAMLSALVVGVFLSFVSLPPVRSFIASGKRMIEWGLSQLFIPLLPLYVFGFFLKMLQELPLAQLCGTYGMVFILSVSMQLVYLAAAYFVVTGGRWQQAYASFSTAFPSYMTALGTMSSIAALPVSVLCAEKNSKNKPLSQFAMPIMANVHLMGDAVCVPLFALATMHLFTGVLPTFSLYMTFVLFFCLTMLAVSGIPGGGIIMMLPLLKSLFGFTPEMLSVMTALYLLQDGFGTAANVMGDGALVILLDKISRALGLHSTKKGKTT